MKKLNRKQLPIYAKINKTVDIVRLQNYCRDNGYVDFGKYSDVKHGNHEGYSAFLEAHAYCKNTFFKEEEAESLQGELYEQLYLTEIDPSKLGTPLAQIEASSSSDLSRTKRRDPSSPYYIPEADEYNYGIRNEHVKDIFKEILDMFESPVCRVRLAVLKPGFTIKPHIDYDPTYIVRYHIPIFTNEDVVVGGKVNEDVIEYHIPADGSVYFFNSGVLHWVSNNGTEPRLHLVVDTNGQDDLQFI